MTEGPRPSLRRRVLLGTGGVLLAWIAFTALTWPRASPLASAYPASTAFIDRWRDRERAAGRDGEVLWQPVPLSRISRNLQHAVLVAEDDRFFDHGGFATEEIRKAIEDARRGDKPLRGASTITQQLAKNLWLSPSRNPLRKLKEAMLTVQLEKALGKERILDLYLNTCELGPGVYGAEAASRRYFGKGADALTPDEAAQLAAALTRPATWHPGVTTRGYRARVALIRDRMERWPWVLPPPR